MKYTKLLEHLTKYIPTSLSPLCQLTILKPNNIDIIQLSSKLARIILILTSFKSLTLQLD
jgi:hypothetical protein